jgi:hypothetical protein
MENTLEDNLKPNAKPEKPGIMKLSVIAGTETGITIMKSIHPSPEGFIIKEEGPVNEILHLTGEYPSRDVKGVYDHGVQYYDLKNVHFINNTDIAHLIDLLKSLLKKGVEVRFLHVGEKVKEKICSMGMDHILICS